MSKILTGEALSTAALTPSHVKEMFVLFEEYYQATIETFQQDLGKKNWVIVLRETSSGSIQGFSTLAFYKSSLPSGEFGVVYSGDTILRPAFWGTPELPRTWIKIALEIGETLPKPLYWLLISSGYKTYRFLTVFFKEYYPRYDQPTPANSQALIHHLARERFGMEFHPELGIVRFQTSATPLKAGVAEITKSRLKDPHVAFFVEANPGHTVGDELVCITRLHPDNFTPAGMRMIR